MLSAPPFHPTQIRHIGLGKKFVTINQVLGSLFVSLIFIHTFLDKHDEDNGKCPKGHELEPESWKAYLKSETDREYRICDKCCYDQAIKPLGFTYNCSECDYDVCPKCYNKKYEDFVDILCFLDELKELIKEYKDDPENNDLRN